MNLMMMRLGANYGNLDIYKNKKFAHENYSIFNKYKNRELV